MNATSRKTTENSLQELAPTQEGHSKASREQAALPRVSSGSEISLSEWLEVSWFYPEGFEKDRIIERPDSLIVLGQNVAYKFFKFHPSAATDTLYTRSQATDDQAQSTRTLSAFHWQWRRACQEVLDNRELAPDLHLGLRVLRWVDGEPHWITEFPSGDVSPWTPPVDADHVAIVMRRIEPGARFAGALRDDREITAAELGGVVKSLSKFYTKRFRQGLVSFLDNSDDALVAMRSRYINRLEDFIAKHGAFLDQFSLVALQEAKGYLKVSLEKNAEEILCRGRKGFRIECHGDLRAENICILPLQSGGRVVSILGRSRLRGFLRSEDLLYDVATLVIDLSLSGYSQIASEFERRFFAQLPELENEQLYKFYLVAAAVERAICALERSSADDPPSANSLLAYALRVSIGLPERFLLGIGGHCNDGRNDIARGIAELSGATYVDEEAVAASNASFSELDEMVFEKLLRAAKQSLEFGVPAVIAWPFNRDEEKLNLSRLAKSLDVEFLLVKCDMSSAERVNRLLDIFEGSSNGGSDGSHTSTESRRRISRKNTLLAVPEFGGNNNQFHLTLEPSVQQPELARHVLRELAARCRSQERAELDED